MAIPTNALVASVFKQTTVRTMHEQGLRYVRSWYFEERKTHEGQQEQNDKCLLQDPRAVAHGSLICVATNRRKRCAHSHRAKLAKAGGRASKRVLPLKVTKARGLLFHGRNERTALLISEAKTRTRARTGRARAHEKAHRAIRPDLRVEVCCLRFQKKTQHEKKKYCGTSPTLNREATALQVHRCA